MVTISELVLGDSRQLTVELEPMMLQSMLPGRNQSIRHMDTAGEVFCTSLVILMALTSEKFVGFVTSLREAGDLYPGLRISLTSDEISSGLFDGRGQDGQRHASNDKLDELHSGNLYHV